jgi:hypothetical protein
MSVEIPPGFCDPPKTRPDYWPDNANVRRAVDWFKSLMSDTEWSRRREAAAHKLYSAALGEPNDPSGKGRFFAEADTFGWYLFLADAFIDHFWNYEPMFGSRVIPIFEAIGRNLPLLEAVPGVRERVRKIVGSEKRQPNGGIFEFLVAGAYRRAGADVTFVEETPGRGKSSDMLVQFDGSEWAIECKRMETSEYGERERAQMRELWGPSSAWLSKIERSTFGDVHFTVEIEAVPAHYLSGKVKEWLASSLPSFAWKDEISYGIVGDLDLTPLQAVLADNEVLAVGTRMQELLSGRYVRNANYISVLKMKPAKNPRWIEDCSLAILIRWESEAPAAIDAKARDILRKLAEATEQLPENKAGIIHIGFEAVDGDEVEKARYEKIIRSVSGFDPRSKHLEYVFCHYFVPESPPDQSWAFDETTQWFGIRPTLPLPLKEFFLVGPSTAAAKSGTHWQR